MKPAAVVFDLFGTLLDISSLSAAAAPLTSDPSAFIAAWRDKQIAYSFAATIMNRYEDFDAITERALRYAAARHRIDASAEILARLAAEWRRVTAFSDARDSLAELRAAGYRCAVLTNGTPATAAAALAAARLHTAVEPVLSVDALRVYKPDRRVYELARSHFDDTAERIAFVTSNGWDATGAAEFGYFTVWCNRAGLPAETLGAAPAAIIGSLSELPALFEIGGERGSADR